MSSIARRAARVGMVFGEWENQGGIAFMKELERRERSEFDFFGEVRTCGVCGFDAVPKMYGNGDEAFEVCPECRSVDSFPPVEVEPK